LPMALSVLALVSLVALLSVRAVLPMTDDSWIVGAGRIVDPRIRGVVVGLGADEEGRALQTPSARVQRVARRDVLLPLPLPVLALLALVSLVALLAVRAIEASIAFWSLRPCDALWTRGARIALETLRSNQTLGARGARVALETLRSNRTL